jgi:hypothetical protein
MDYQNAQIILAGAREGKNAIKNKIDIEIEESLRYRVCRCTTK